ncbi:MAG: DUF945 family protein [Pseudomonadota bacterium]
MRKLLLVISVLLILAGLIGPWATGKLGEQAFLDHQQQLTEGLPDWLLLVENELDRGWFRSKARQRFVITDPARATALEGWVGTGVFGDQPAIVADSVIVHGPLTRLFRLAIAEAHTTLSADDGGDAVTPLPLGLSTAIGFTGNTTVEAMVAPTRLDNPGASIEWQALNAQLTLQPRSGHHRLRVRTPSLQITSPQMALSLVAPEADIRLLQEGTGLLFAGRYNSELAPPDTAGALQPDADIEGEWSLDGLDLTTLPALKALGDALQAPAAVPGVVLAENFTLLQQALQKPIGLDWQQAMDTDDGNVVTRIQLALPDAGALPQVADANAILQSLITGFTATIEADLAGTYVEAQRDQPTASGQQVRQLLGLAALRENDDGRYRMLLELAQGQAVLNGRPVGGPPVPPAASPAD